MSYSSYYHIVVRPIIDHAPERDVNSAMFEGDSDSYNWSLSGAYIVND